MGDWRLFVANQSHRVVRHPDEAIGKGKHRVTKVPDAPKDAQEVNPVVWN